MSAYLHLAERVFRCGVLLGIISSPSTKRSTRMVLSRAKMLSVDFNLQTRRKGRKSPCYCAEDRHGQSIQRMAHWLQRTRPRRWSFKAWSVEQRFV
jgi:hypothetical protein